MRPAACHPEKNHFAKEKCWACYFAAYKRATPVFREKQRQYDLVYKRRTRQQRMPKLRNSRYKSLYGITLEEYEAQLAKQQGRCAICGELPGTMRLAVDHDHASGHIRGLLHSQCNLLLPKGVTPEMLRRAAEYLETT